MKILIRRESNIIFKMSKSNSVTSIYYKIPNFENLTVKQRISLIESLLPIPTTVEDAFNRAKTGLYAIDRMSCMLIEQLCEEQEEYSNKSALQFWTDIAADCESRFQGNINSLMIHKTEHQRKLAHKL